MRRWDGLVERYTAELATRGLTISTIEMRSRELVRFGGWLKKRCPRPQLEAVDADLIVRYIEARGSFHSRSTVASVVSILRCMGEFLVREGLWRANPLRWMHGPKMDVRRRLPRRIDREQLRLLWDAARGRRQEHARYQVLCLLAILYGTGLRRGELQRLNLQDWDPTHCVLQIDGRKTGRARQVAVCEGVARCIEAYLPHRHNRLARCGRVDEPALLVNKRGHRFDGASVGLLLGRLCESAGLPRLTLHQFRHTCASDLLDAGVALPDVQRMLGHAVIGSTVRYLSIADPERAAAISKHPINLFLGGSTEERRAS